ncbi:hypothetical protein [Agromyces seonyuensis]|uniref:Uncharacterized protein n=1 Tax=Agromyces seonyuensis TaxID=2662446 RepID=A0A6I4NXN0_9MICO|nr:hypothetical protein [Agromyces seonyuensis]MWB99110.1 hypothetical protein [Agromyces seonyuensis]
MDTAVSYTAKLLDGPLEGRTFSTELTESGEPKSQLSIPVEVGKHLRYSFAGGIEYDEPSGKPSAVDYRYAGADFD